MEKKKGKFREIVIGICLLCLVASAGFAALTYRDRNILDKQVESQKHALATADKQYRDLKSSYDQDEQKLAQQGQELQDLRPDDEKLKSSIGAFAMQAASCDTLKRTLNIKGSGT
jgi:DNA repair exonuclease SbcCD ATPase subunit